MRGASSKGYCRLRCGRSERDDQSLTDGLVLPMQQASDIEASGVTITLRSPAKINWRLRVLGRRDDGFHEIESLMTTVTLYDELVFRARSDSELRLSCTVQPPCDASDVPTDHRNLILRAASLLATRVGRPLGMTCQLTKRIPTGGGLGGGSSNAASTLIALNRLWALNEPVENLTLLAGELGSDVPFFLAGPSAVVRGRGERIRSVPHPWRGWIVLMFPGFPVSTGAVYQAWQSGPKDDGLLVMSSENEGRLMAAEWMASTFNGLEEPAMVVCPALRDMYQQVMATADRSVRVSGSGSTMFTAFDTQDEAHQFARLMDARLGIPSAVVEPV